MTSPSSTPPSAVTSSGHSVADEIAGPVDVWPHTQRVMPWLVAIFLFAVCLVPIDSITLQVPLPIDPKLDRILLGVTGLFWVLALWSGGPQRPEFPRLGAVGLAVWLWVFTAFLSVMTMLPTLVLEDQVALTVKKLVLMLAFVVFFLTVVSTIRPTEIRNFISLWLGLTGVLAVGAIYSFVAQTEPFRDIAGDVFRGPFIVRTFQVITDGGVTVVGPAAHGLALTTMLVLPMPFILQRALDGRDRRTSLGYGGLLLLCALGSQTSGRKSAIVVPVVIGLVMLAYRPRQLVRFWPVLLAFIPLTQIVTPGAFSSILSRADSDNAAAAQSTKDRIQDWGGSMPDLIAHPWFGKGYGSNDPGTYRVLDNQWLSTMVETGFLGTAALLGILVSAWALCHRLSKRAVDEEIRGLAVGGAAAVIAFGVSMALYDTLAFVQSFYLMLFVIGLIVVVNDGARQRAATTRDAPPHEAAP